MKHHSVLVLAAVALTAGCGPAAASAPALGVTAPSLHVEPPTAGCSVLDGKPDRRCTPGVRNPQVTQLDIASTICRKGWTATVRPPTSYTSPLKARQLALYGEPPPVSLYEEDHVLPLELGGDPQAEGNLFPQPYAGRGARVKDVQENSLNRAVCGGRVKLADAQAQILADWTH